MSDPSELPGPGGAERVPAWAAGRNRRRVTVVPDGPVLVEGPVELVLGDGTTVHSDRFVVAVCACRRSRRYPFCDTSHRRRVRTESAGGHGREA